MTPAATTSWSCAFQFDNFEDLSQVPRDDPIAHQPEIARGARCQRACFVNLQAGRIHSKHNIRRL
jgi:hypothetical protein